MQVSHTCSWVAGTAALTGCAVLEGSLGFTPHGLAVLHESEVAGLLPGR